MSLAGVIILIFSLVATLTIARTRSDLGFYAFVLCLHIAATLTYFNYTLSNEADAFYYYRYSATPQDFGTGTQFIRFILNLFRSIIDLTYLDAFLLFQLFGFLGIILLHRAVVKFTENGFAVRVAILSGLLLAPGLHFWTSAIGKDSLSIFAYALIALGLAQERPHITLTISGLILYFLIRPYVGLFLTCAMTLAFLWPFGRTPSHFRWFGLWAVVGAILMIPSIYATIGVADTTIADTIAYLEYRHNFVFKGTSDYEITTQTPPERLFHYLFRPLFFDASGLFGLIASVENLCLLLIFAYLFLYSGTLSRLIRVSATLRFHAFFLVIFLAVVSQVTSNLGIAVRQKFMIIPALLLLFTAVVAYRNRRRQDQREALAQLYEYSEGGRTREGKPRRGNLSVAE